jgi:glutathione synthase/RimK-type ligase-like ATP-grasp enzyme
MILIIGWPRDQTILHTVIAAKHFQVPYFFFDVLRFAREGEYRWDFRARKGHLGYEGTSISLPNPEISAIYVRPVDMLERVAARERRAMAARMRALSEILRNVETLTVNRPGTDLSNSAKLYHLHLLSTCGFIVPPSLLTNNENEAREFLARVPDVVYKGASGEKTIASAFEPKLHSRLKTLTRSPVLFQARIYGNDVRTHLVGSEFFSESIKSESVNYQYDRGPKIFARTEIPEEIAEKCLRYQSLSGLHFIGFDFKVTNTGEYVMLEANPMPGYDSYDQRLNLAISQSLFKLLGDKHAVR